MTVCEWAGLAPDVRETARASASGARRIVIATLAYQRLRALWPGAAAGRLNSSAAHIFVWSWYTSFATAPGPSRSTAARREAAECAEASVDRPAAPYCLGSSEHLQNVCGEACFPCVGPGSARGRLSNILGPTTA